MNEYDIEEAFAAIEEELIASMMRNMVRHKIEEVDQDIQWEMWQAKQLEALNEYKRKNQKQFSKQFSYINSQMEELILIANADGQLDQEADILKAIKNGFKGAKKISGTMAAEFFKLNDRKLDALIRATMNDMSKAETAILRMANDKYRKAIFNAQVYANTGAGTYEKAVDMATKDMLTSGLNCVEYANGARHTLKDYADMAIRTASKRAYLQGEGAKRQEWGISTVIMNKRGNPCPKCLPFVGKVLIDDVWSGGRSDGIDPETGKKYPTMSYAISQGLYHPRCKDSHTTYFPGISTADDTWTKKELEDIGLQAKQEAKQQYAKRQAEKFERLAKYSLDEENRKLYAARKEQWEDIGTIDKYFGKSVVKSKDSGIMMSGARIIDPDGDAGVKFAKMYYDEIRSFSTDVEKIAKNMGKSEKDIKQIKDYLFEGGFDPDCAIAQSWQRLMNGKGIKAHDKTLIEHELLEMRIKKENPEIEHWKAHEIATKKYNYQREAAEYYGSLEKHK